MASLNFKRPSSVIEWCGDVLNTKLDAQEQAEWRLVSMHCYFAVRPQQWPLLVSPPDRQACRGEMVGSSHLDAKLNAVQ